MSECGRNKAMTHIPRCGSKRDRGGVNRCEHANIRVSLSMRFILLNPHLLTSFDDLFRPLSDFSYHGECPEKRSSV